MDGLLFLLLLILAVPVSIIGLFVAQGNLRDRVTRLERELEQLRAAGLPPSAAPAPDPLWREDYAAALRQAPPPDQPPPQAWTQEGLPPQEPWPEQKPWPEQEPAAGEPLPDEAAGAPTETFGSLFERFVAGRLLVWVGGAALIGAAILLIKHSIEVGLLTPQARMIAAAVFGLSLVILGELSPRIRWLSDDPRVRQALVGAGIVTLYATPYGSHVLYGLIDSRTAAAAMLLVSGAALVLSLRHGPPTAAMGLIGAFLAPALVGDPSSSALPLLVYLTIVNGAVFGIAWRRGWTWLAAASLVFSFLWSAYLLDRPPSDAMPVGVFVIALSLAGALVRPGRGTQLLWVQPLIVGLVQLSVLVGRSDLGGAAWAMFGALAATAVALSLLRAEHRFAPLSALLLALLLIAVKAPEHDPFVPWAAAAVTLLFAGVSIPLAARGERLLRTITACAALAVPAPLLRAASPELLLRPAWAAAFAALAAAALLLAWLQRAEAGKEEPADGPLFLAAASAALLLGLAVYDLLPETLLAAGWAAVAVVVALAGRRLREPGFGLVALAAALVAAIRGFGDAGTLTQTVTASLIGFPATAESLPPAGTAMLSLALPALLFAALAYALHAPARGRRFLLAAAAAFGLASAYVLAKQLFGLSAGEDFDRRGFAERVAITQSLFLAGWLLASGRLRSARFPQEGLARLGGALTLVAALRLIWFDMLLHNPLLDEQWVGTLPVANLILPAFFLSAFWLYEARRRADAETRSGFWLLAFLASLVWGVMLTVRQLFQGPWLHSAESWPLAEIYMYSLAGLLLSASLIVGGIRLKDKAVRIAGLALLTATIVKVFASDASALEGVLRILSFFGLGVGLIGVALLYGPVLRAESGARDQP